MARLARIASPQTQIGSKFYDILIPGFFIMLLLLVTACDRSATITPSGRELSLAAANTPTNGATREIQGQDALFTQFAGNTLRFDRISVEQGLSQSTVFSALQDSRGIMWFGTQDGLNKYDGYNFTIYKHDPENPNSLSDNWVWTIHEDHTGALWIGTQSGGLDRLVPSASSTQLSRSGQALSEAEGSETELDQFTHYSSDPEDPNSLSDNEVLSVYEDRDGLLWIGTRGGLDRFDRENESFAHYRNDPDDPDTLSSNAVLSIYEDQSGVLWVGTDRGGLNRFDRENESFTRFASDPSDPHSLSNDSLWTIFEDQSGALWIGTDDGLNRFERENERFIQYRNDPEDLHSLSHNEIRSIYQDRDGVLWIGTWGGGLNRFDREGETFAYYQNDPGDPHSLSQDRVLAIFEDREGVLWIGTDAGGLNKLGVGRWNSAHYQNDPNDPNSLSNNNVRGIYEDREGTLWIGTDAGLDRFDQSKGHWVRYQNDPSDPHSLGDNAVVSIHEDREGILWIGTRNGLDRFDLATGRFTHHRADPNDPHSLSDNVVTAIYQDQAGTLWIGTFGGGLNTLVPSVALSEIEGEAEGSDHDMQSFSHYLAEPNDLQSLSNNLILAIYEDRDEALWIGTWGSGLDRFDRENETFTHYDNALSDSRSLSHNIVGAIYEDREGALWIGTYGGGLNKFDRATETFTHYREKDGLPSDFVYGILEDQHGDLWLSTNNGLSRFNPQTETFKNFDASDGLQSNEFNSFSSYKSSSGEMFFGGINGFNTFHPDNIKDNRTIPPVVLTGLTQGGEALDIGGTTETIREITLKWPDNFFEFEFAALSYDQPEKNQYAYMLEGFDEDWNSIGNRRYGRYTNLPGGTYTLRMIGSNNDGVWNEEGTSLAVSVVPPFWATWWFRGIAILALISSLVIGYQLRVRSVEARSRELEAQVEQRTAELRQEIEQRIKAEESLRQSEREKAVAEERGRLARDLHDSVTQSLFAMTMYADAAVRQLSKEQMETVGVNIRKLRRTAREVLGEMRLLVFELRPLILEKEGLVAALEARLEGVEKRAGLQTELIVEGEGRLPYDLEEGLYRIAHESLNNVLKHARAKNVVVSLRITEQPNSVFLEIADDGVGFDLAAAQEHGGLGMRGMAERAELLGGRMKVVSEPGTGTTVKTEVKIRQ